MAKNTNLKPRTKKCKERFNYKNYEAKQKESGKGARIKHEMTRRVVKKFVKKSPEYHHLAAYQEVALRMMQYNHLCRGMVDNLNYDRTMRRKMDFSHTPKSRLWRNVKRLPIKLPGELLIHTAGKAA